jgi:hypothetical protein
MACKKKFVSVCTTCLQDKILTPFVHSSYLLPDDSAGRIARELWWTSQEFSSAGIISPWFSHTHVLLGEWTIGPLVATVQRHSLTMSHSINMINQSISNIKIQEFKYGFMVKPSKIQGQKYYIYKSRSIQQWHILPSFAAATLSCQSIKQYKYSISGKLKTCNHDSAFH